MKVKFAKLKTYGEHKAFERIVLRAELLFRASGIEHDRTSIEMDVLAVHHSNPLRLIELADADEFNFAHDLAGIYRHLNRTTGELENHFRPRFSMPQHKHSPWMSEEQFDTTLKRAKRRKAGQKAAAMRKAKTAHKR